MYYLHLDLLPMKITYFTQFGFFNAHLKFVYGSVNAFVII